MDYRNDPKAMQAQQIRKSPITDLVSRIRGTLGEVDARFGRLAETLQPFIRQEPSKEVGGSAGESYSSMHAQELASVLLELERLSSRIDYVQTHLDI
jgi:hypothetical protein